MRKPTKAEVEAVAKAIYIAQYPDAWDWDGLPKMGRKELRRIANIAIKALDHHRTKSPHGGGKGK